jgi:hypothetical protein
MVFMGRLQSNAAVSAAELVRDLSNLVPRSAFQPHEDHGFPDGRSAPAKRRGVHLLRGEASRRAGCRRSAVRFDEWETERCRMPQATAPILDSTIAELPVRANDWDSQNNGELPHKTPTLLSQPNLDSLKKFPGMFEANRGN